MSSFPEHKENILALKEMGFDVSGSMDNNEVTLESWGYDDQVYFYAEVITVLKEHGFKVIPKPK
ncbi:hypothetical protein A3715_10395 [Oleiphilus sp. HI0009]|nr:hypothetical protein A3715_10395 [Oleiphilus sp. HI0009]